MKGLSTLHALAYIKLPLLFIRGYWDLLYILLYIHECMYKHTYAAVLLSQTLMYLTNL